MNDRGKTSPPMVILSGPTRGLGRALFEQLISQTYFVIGIGRDLGRIAAVAKSTTAPVELIEADLGADSEALSDVMGTLRRIVSSTTTGPIVFISNASIIEPIGLATSLTLSGLDRTMQINCLAPLVISNDLTEASLKQGRPLLILNVSSGASSRPIRGWQAYCISKAAFKMGLDVLATENLHVQIVHFDPGVMNTSMQQVIREQHEVDMPEVKTFRAYKEEAVLKAPLTVATELISLMKRHL
jgi:benzil reductase ((S)-benzoin forming)